MKQQISIGNPRNRIFQPISFEFCYLKKRAVTTGNQDEQSDDGRDVTYADVFINSNL